MQYNNRELRRYCNKVKKLLKLFTSKTRKIILKDFYSSLYEFMDVNPDASMSDIEDRFGTPELFADEYIASLSEEQLKRNLDKTKWVKTFIIIAILVAILGLALCIIIVIILGKNSEVRYAGTRYITNYLNIMQ